MGAQGPSGILSVAVISGAASDVAGAAADFAFVGPTTPITLTGTQRLTGTAQASLGFFAGGTQLFGYDLCYRSTASSTVLTFSGGNYLIGEAGGQLVSWGAAASISLPAGTYDVGFCAYNPADYALDYYSNVTGWIIVSN